MLLIARQIQSMNTVHSWLVAGEEGYICSCTDVQKYKHMMYHFVNQCSFLNCMNYHLGEMYELKGISSKQDYKGLLIWQSWRPLLATNHLINTSRSLASRIWHPSSFFLKVSRKLYFLQPLSLTRRIFDSSRSALGFISLYLA